MILLIPAPPHLPTGALITALAWLGLAVPPVKADHCGLPRGDDVIIYQNANRGDPCRRLGWGRYPNASSFGLPNDSISAIDVGAGSRAVLFQDSNFGGKAYHFEGGMNWGSLGDANDRTSSIEIFPMVGGRAATIYKGNYPRDAEAFWADEGQGLANDGENWFLIKRDRIFKVHSSSSLAAGSTSVAPIRLPAGPHNHFGDGDFFAGFLLVPLESPGSDKPRALVFRGSDMALVADVSMADSPGKNAPWMAVQASRSLAFTSPFHLAMDARIRAYAFQLPARGLPPTLVPVPAQDIFLQDRQGKPMPLSAVQGGVFNPAGTLLYLSTGACGGGRVHVFAVDNNTHKATLQAQSSNGSGTFNYENHEDFTFGRCTGDETEGLDWFDIPAARARGVKVLTDVPASHLHLMMVDVDAGADQVFLKHYALFP